MVLRLTNEEIDLMKTTLLDSVRAIRQEERVKCAGPSCSGIQLCQKRLRLEALLETVDEQRAAVARAASANRIETIPLRRTSSPDYFPELVA